MYSENSTTEFWEFFYKLEDLFKEVTIFVAHKGQRTKSEDGQNIIDKIAINENDRQVFNNYIKTASGRVFQGIAIMAQDISDGNQFDVALENDPEGHILYTLDLPTVFDANLIQVLDDQLKNALVSYVKKEWYRLIGMKQEGIDESEVYDELMKEIRSIGMNRTTPLQRPHRTL